MTQLCTRVGTASCTALEATVGAGFKEMAVQELDQMWQNSFSGAFNTWSPTFSEDGWFAD